MARNRHLDCLGWRGATVINDLIKNRRFNLKATDRKSGSSSYSVRLDTCPPFSSSLPPSTPPQASSPPLSQLSTYNKFDSAAFSALTVRSSTSTSTSTTTGTSSSNSNSGGSSSGPLPPSPSLGLLFSSSHLHSFIVFLPGSCCVSCWLWGILCARRFFAHSPYLLF